MMNGYQKIRCTGFPETLNDCRRQKDRKNQRAQQQVDASNSGDEHPPPAAKEMNSFKKAIRDSR